MSYYDTFLIVNQSPSIRWGERLQELSNKAFINSSTYQTDIEEETSFGSLDFSNIEARITSLVDAKTGQRVNDDFKKVIFADFSHRPSLGTRYSFDDNIWLAFSIDNIKSVTSSAYLRRCNNTLNFQDKYGNIYREPCCIDYKATETQISSGETIAVPSGRIYIQCQYNSHTKNICIDKRFILGSFVYKVRYISDYDRQKTFDKDGCTLMSFYADIDNIAAYDNFELGIADYKCYNYSILCDKEITGKVGDTGNINVTLMLDEKPVLDEKIDYEVVSGNDIISVDNKGTYTMLKNGDAEVKVSMNNLNSCYSIVKFSVNDKQNAPYVTPEITIIPINQTVDYTIIFNSPLIITIETENPSYYYNFSVSGNSFSISNYKQSNYPINIYYKTEDESVSGKFIVYLGGIF